jgi:hypothetical protein
LIGLAVPIGIIMVVSLGVNVWLCRKYKAAENSPQGG